MGFRFRKSLRLLPGLRLNLSKRGASSLSIGGKGLTVNLGKKGSRTTVGIPGTGLSYSTYEKNAEIGQDMAQGRPRGKTWLLIAAIVLAFVIAALI